MKVYIVHGYTANPDKHWFPWLDQALSQCNIACERLTMPNSDNPRPESWLAHLEQKITLDELSTNNKTVLVGHSLGTIACLTFLAKHQRTPAGTVLVSGFYQPLNTLPELTPFCNYYAQFPPVPPQNCHVITALDDQIVPHCYSDALAQHLQANYTRLNQGGHFLDREGYTELPIVLDIVKKYLHNN